MRILVIKRDKIGDLLLTTPMLAHLRRTRPGDEIHLLANDYNAWVVRDNPHIDRLWVYPRVRIGRKVSVTAAVQSAWQLLELRRQRYDVAIVANGAESHRAIKRALVVGAKRVIAYVDDPARWPRVSDRLRVDRSLHECDALLAMLAPLGIPRPHETIWPMFSLPAGEQAFAERWLAERGLAPRRYVVLGLGARRAKKQPTRAQILAWTRRIKDDLALDTVFMWTPGKGDSPLYPGDDDVAQPVLDACAPWIHPFRGPILPALGLIWNARTSLFPDSGLMHFAAASPGGVLGFFAETDVSPSPTNWAPRGPRATYLEAQKSVAELSDDEVLEIVRALATS
ncbi:MAG TPA: glycosyltransferase family 9 protein [Candidatus Binatia bacterium]|nr:glycosyltransferase family 9 protein [Candidatus Binatia bacterium]